MNDRIVSPSIPPDAPYVAPHVVESIESLTERGERFSWLKLAWHPGRRWVVYEVIPAFATPALVLDPEFPMVPMGEFHIPDPNHRIRLNPGMVDSTQLRILEETGRFARPIWVVQGPNGGHPRSLSKAQRRLLATKGVEKIDLEVGDLPYAPIDSRVPARIRALDRVATSTKVVDAYFANPDLFDEEEAAECEQVKNELTQWLLESVRADIDEVGVKQVVGAMHKSADAVHVTDEMLFT